jgi:multiple sugar transport system substrate-binding protein
MTEIDFAIWPVAVDVVRAGLKRFTDQTGQAVRLHVLEGEYGQAMDAVFDEGKTFDLFYAQRGEAARWYGAGHIRPIDDMPMFDVLRPRIMHPIEVDCHDNDGRLIGLTYYNGGPFCLFRNQALLDRAGLFVSGIVEQYPQTWEEVAEQARFLKRKGFCEFPILMHWHDAPTGLPWALIAHGFSEGEQFVDGTRPSFGINSAILKVLSTWRRWVEEGLVDPVSVRFDEGAMHDAWLSGHHAFHPHIDYKTRLYNRTDRGEWTHQNAVMPGSTQDTVLVGHAMLCADRGASSGALDLMRFLGGMDATGDLWMHRQWILNANMAVPYPELYDDPECRTSILENLYKPLAEREFEFLMNGRRRVKAPGFLRLRWYKDWEKKAHSLIKDELILDQRKTPEQIVQELRALAHALSDELQTPSAF